VKCVLIINTPKSQLLNSQNREEQTSKISVFTKIPSILKDGYIDSSIKEQELFLNKLMLKSNFQLRNMGVLFKYKINTIAA